MGRADYSIATKEERQQVIDLLERNLEELIRDNKARDPDRLRAEVEKFCTGIREGRVYMGKDFERLVMIFRKESPF